MSLATVSIYPIPEGTTVDTLRELFAAYPIVRVQLNSNRAYIEFKTPFVVEQISLKYEECKVPELGDAEISFVDTDFKWERDAEGKGKGGEIGQEGEGENKGKGKERERCLIAVRSCQEEQMSEKVLKSIFAKLNVLRIVKDQGTVLIQFADEDQMEKLEGIFAGLKVPALGPNAYIDPDYQVKMDQFTQIYVKQQTKQKKMQQFQEAIQKQKTLHAQEQAKKALQQIKQAEITKRKEQQLKQEKERLQYKEKKQKQLEQLQRVEDLIKKEAEMKQKMEEQELIRMQAEAKLIAEKSAEIKASPTKNEINLAELHRKSQSKEVALVKPVVTSQVVSSQVSPPAGHPSATSISISPVQEPLLAFQVKPSAQPSPSTCSNKTQFVLTLLLAVWLYWVAFK